MAKKPKIEDDPLPPDTTTLEADHKASAENVADLRTALAEAEADFQEKTDALAAAQPQPEPITGPRIKLEHSGEVVAVQEGEQRERRLLIAGHNYEHVSDVEDQGEVIWVYREM